MNIINATSWQQQAINPLRSSEAAAEQQAQFRAVVASNGASAQQQNRGNTAQQNADDAREEAFAKLKIQLQNPDSSRREQASVAKADAPASSAAQEFRDYMALSPAEKIKLKLLNELGITQEEFDSMPPEEQEKIERKIADQMKKETELQSLAALNAHVQAPVLSAKRVAQLTPTNPAAEKPNADWLQTDPLA
ncbi:hypothetical protein [Pseudomonas sp. BBP2017]|uniref:hypothetical protein n=1 Tax=Pseudomonas sp. BBP2017 TaxID=2109731 RepID=UPI0011B2432A|nr:hypothetical protein [Pseudomonas sp. BBP2017]